MTDNLKNKIIKYLNSEYPELEQFETEKYPDYIFFMKDGKFIFYYNKKNGSVGISYDKIWSFLESFFGLEYKEIQVLTKEWVEEHYKLEVTTTSLRKTYMTYMVEEHYKLEVTTSPLFALKLGQIVEEHYKLETNDR
jgi:hypothetical protein